jgi:PKD repeat protein
MLKQIMAIVLVAGLLIPVHAILKADGRFIKDPCGRKVIFRGVEWVINDNFDEVAKSGANYVREMLWDAHERVSADELDRKIGKAVANGMFYGVAPWGNDPNYVKYNAWFNRPEIKEVLKKWEDYIIIHACGEVTGADYDEWRKLAKSIIDEFRGYGYKCPLDIMSTGYGRDPTPILKYGQEIFDYDPEKNIILGCQMYWGTYYTNKWMSIAEACKKFAELDFPVQVGACPSDCDTDCGIEAWNEAWKNELGCLWWSWHGGSSHSLTTNEKFNSLTPKGEMVLVSGEYSMQKTSKRSQWLLGGGACGGVRATIAATPASGPYPLTVSLDASGSMGEGLTYEWEFGDGQSSSSATVEHTFQNAGEYAVRLVVSNTDDSDTATTAIRVLDPATDPILLSTVSATASSEESSDFAGHLSATNAIDGDRLSRWASDATDNEWIYIDLGSAQSFNRIILQWETAYGSEYAIQVSNDAQNWSDIFTQSSGDGGVDTIDADASARYVRMLGVARGTEWGYSLYEFGVYSLPQATAIASPIRMHSGRETDHTVGSRIYDIRGRLISAGSQPGNSSPSVHGVYIVRGSESRRAVHVTKR